jgi:protein-tyrosine kinase
MSVAFSDRRADERARGNDRALLGEQLVDAGKLTASQVATILNAQSLRNLRFGETAVALGILSEDDVRSALAQQYNYPVIAGGTGGLSPELFAVAYPHSRQSEALRTLRSKLSMRWFTDRRTSLTISSARALEGSPGIAANLAISYAQLGERVLLIDANMRDPRQHQLFGLDNTTGLSGLLSERCDAETALAAVPGLETLSVMPAGAVPPNPQELLNRVAFTYLVETAPRLFDIILIDTPAMLEFADAQLVATITGGCLLSARRHRTRVDDMEEIRHQLLGSRIEIVGAVVSD